MATGACLILPLAVGVVMVLAALDSRKEPETLTGVRRVKNLAGNLHTIYAPIVQTPYRPPSNYIELWILQDDGTWRVTEHEWPEQ